MSEHFLGDSGNFTVELLPDGTLRHRCDYWGELSFYRKEGASATTKAVAPTPKAVAQHPLTGDWTPCRTSEWKSNAPGKHRDRGNDSSSFMSYSSDGSGRWKMRDWYGSSVVGSGPGPRWEGTYKADHMFGG